MNERARKVGEAAYALVEELYPICRSITGQGFRDTLARLQRRITIEVYEVPSGTPVLDWTVPREWNIRDAYVKDESGRRVIDFRESNLHVLNYSVPIHEHMTLEALRPHLFTLPDKPQWIPYRTSYYREAWGFCLSQEALDALTPGVYDVCIDSTLEPGSLTYGEHLVTGATGDEVLISCHSCHPSLANDNLSGMSVAVALAEYLKSLPARRLTYRFLFIPGTIGSITWLARNEHVVPRIRYGLVLSCVGDAGSVTYKRSRRGDAFIDRAVGHVLAQSGDAFEVLDFIPYGYDERQYCSPGFDLPVGCFTRTPNGRFPEYHTSADNLDFLRPEYLADSFEKLCQVIEILEHDGTFMNQSPKGEPQLGKRGLYKGVGGRNELPGYELAMLWVLNLSDGRHSLFDIAERAGMPFEVVRGAADALREAGLLAPAREPQPNPDVSRPSDAFGR